MRWTLLFLAFLTLPLSAEPLTLEQVRETVVRNSHNLKAQDSKLRQSSYKIDEAFSAAYPQLKFSTGTSYLTPTVSFLSPQGSLAITENFNYNVGVQLDQAIHTFGRLKWSTLAASLASEAAAFEVEKKRQETLEIATQAYLDVMFSARAVAVSQQQYETRKHHLQEAELKLGFETALAQAEQNLILARQQSDLARTRLLLLMGRKAREEFELEDLDVPELPTESIDESVQRALATRPGLKALEKATEAADGKVKYEESQNNPQLGFHTSYARQNATAFQPNQLWVAGVQLSVPIFDGGLVKAKVSQAKEDVLQLRENLAEAQRNISLEVEMRHSDLLTSWARKEVAEKALVQADEFLRLAQLRYKVGVSTNLELLQAETSQAEARLAVHQSNYQVLKSYYAWRRASGLELVESPGI